MSVVVALLAAAISGCGKVVVNPETTVKPASATRGATTSEITAPNAQIEAQGTKARSTPLPAAVEDPVAADLSAQADDILKRHPTKDAIELLNVPEVNDKLKVGLKRLGEDPALGKQIESTVSLAAKLKGLEGAPGSFRLDMDIKSYDKARTKRMLETVLSEDPKRIVGFLSEEIGEATPELSLGGAKRASNGVAIEANPTPAAK